MDRSYLIRTIRYLQRGHQLRIFKLKPEPEATIRKKTHLMPGNVKVRMVGTYAGKFGRRGCICCETSYLSYYSH